MTQDPNHKDYICYYEEMTDDDYQFILKSIGKLENRIKAGFMNVTTKTGDTMPRPLYTYRELHCAFDIETSTVYTTNIMNGKQDYYSAMWVAQFAVNNIGIRFRLWPHVREFFQKFPQMLGLGANETIIVFVHNLDYETSYLKHRLNIDPRTFFGKSRQKPIKYVAEKHIYFHDSYSITNCSLEMLAKLYSTKHQKTKQDIDHNKPRNFLTPITKTEERYIFNDVFVLTDFAKILFEMYDFIPDTGTQVIAKDIEKAALEMGGEFVGEKVFEDWKNKADTDRDILKRLHGKIFGYEYTMNGMKRTVKGIVSPDFFTPFTDCGTTPPPQGVTQDGKTIYDFYTWLYRGGIAKSNARYTSSDNYLPYGVRQRVGGQDYTSSYPFVMTAFNYPISAFEEIEIDPDTLTLEYDHPDFENYRYIFIMEFTVFESTNDICIESESKVKGVNIIEDNGRIYKADKITTCLTDCDYALYKMFYKWETKTVLKAFRAKAGKLPDYLLYPLWKYGKAKQELKHDETRKTEYGLNKAKFNSVYGLTVKQPVYKNYYFGNEITGRDSYISTETDVLTFFGIKQDIQHSVDNYREEIEEHEKEHIKPKNYIESVSSFILSPFWGIWVCAFARYNLLKTVYKIGLESDWITNDVVYMDTDSVYYINPAKHEHLIDEWNNYVKERVSKRLPDEYKKSLGKLGQFDNIALDDTHGYSNTFINFKTLGSKRYIKEMQFPKRKKTKATIAGLPVGILENYCKRNKLDMWLEFDNLMNFEHNIDSEDMTEQDKVKLGRKYHDEKMMFEINGEIVTEYSSCTLYPTTFTLKMNSLYLARLKQAHDEIQGGKYATDIIY